LARLRRRALNDKYQYSTAWFIQHRAMGGLVISLKVDWVKRKDKPGELSGGYDLVKIS
jgi:hypothetical protein